MADFFATNDLVEEVFPTMRKHGVVRYPQVQPIQAFREWSRLDGSKKGQRDEVIHVVCTDPPVGRRWLYEHRLSDMILQMLPPILDMVEPVQDLANIRFVFNDEAGLFQQWAAGQFWDEFVAEAPAPLFNRINQVRIQALLLLQWVWANPLPNFDDVEWKSPHTNALLANLLGVLIGPNLDSRQMSVRRAVLYASAGFGATEARTVEFGEGAPADEVLRTMAALKTITP